MLKMLSIMSGDGDRRYTMRMLWGLKNCLFGLLFIGFSRTFVFYKRARVSQLLFAALTPK